MNKKFIAAVINIRDSNRPPHLFFSCIVLDNHVCPARGQKIPRNDRFEPERAINQFLHA